MSGPSLYLTTPPRSLFKFPPDYFPTALPPPNDGGSWKAPFAIDPTIFNALLKPQVPLAIAAAYIFAVTSVNAYNRQYAFKQPWAISKTRAFYAFVILHNIFLAVYSFATFLGMGYALIRIFPSNLNNGIAGVADAYCKIHGPRGLGDAVIFNSTLNIWEAKNSLVQLLPNGTPDPTDVGRMWNEGLAFWGWWFYLSKFYEVLDTFIIVAKGKRSATLQTYHHAGAMICMWAGIRYMSPPICMFVFLNSGIHTLMYTYFTIAALEIKVPMKIKRSLTSMQIGQFLLGSSYAALLLFVKYDIPVESVYKIIHPISSLASLVSSSAPEIASSISSAAAAATPTWNAALRRLVLRAIGDEGVAANVRDSNTNQIVMPGVQEAVQRFHEETRYRTEYQTVQCIDTTGEAFAIWLNLIYLAPLTALFVRFFIRAYLKRQSSSGRKVSFSQGVSRAVIDGAKGVNSSMDRAGRYMERSPERVSKELEKDIRDMKEGKYQNGKPNGSANGHMNGNGKMNGKPSQ